MMALGFVSCNNEDENLMDLNESDVNIVVDGVSLQQSLEIIAQIAPIGDSISSTMSRTDLSMEDYNSAVIKVEKRLSEICKPWVAVGKNMVKELLVSSEQFNMSSEEIELVSNLSDEELAVSTLLLSFYSMQNESVVIDGMMITYQRVWDCFVDATGINDIFYLMSELRMNTVDQIIKLLVRKPELIAHFAKVSRCMTYFGLAVTIAQFTYCIMDYAIPATNDYFSLSDIEAAEYTSKVEFIIIP